MDKQTQRNLEMMQRVVRKYQQLDRNGRIRTLTYMRTRVKEKKRRLSGP